MKRRVATFLKVLGLAAIALALLYVVLLLFANRNLKRVRASLVADGRPMSAEAVIPAPLPDAQNAALLYEAAILKLKAASSGDKSLHLALKDAAREVNEDPDAPGVLDAFRQLVSEPAAVEALATLREGTEKPGCRFDVDYSLGAETLLPHLSYFQVYGAVLPAQARLQAVDGDPEAAWTTLLTGLRLADATLDEPTLVSQLIRLATFSRMADGIQDLSATALPSETQFEELAVLLAGFEDLEPLVRALDGERLLFGDWLFNQPRAFFHTNVNGDDIFPGLVLMNSSGLFMKLNEAAYLKVMRSHSASVRKVYNREDAAAEEAWINDIPRYCIFARMIVPALQAAKRRYVSIIARARITRAGLAALRYRQEHGAYPETLGVLGLEDLEDPFSGKPLVYRAGPKGFLLYSVGENMVDDQGVSTEDGDKGDIVWRHGEGAEPQDVPAAAGGPTSGSAGP